jgi:hypothetical protein
MFKVGDKVERVVDCPDSNPWLLFKSKTGKTNAAVFTVTAVSSSGRYIGVDGYSVNGDSAMFHIDNFKPAVPAPVSVSSDNYVPRVNPATKLGIKADQGKPRLGLVLVEVPHAFEKLGTLLGFGADKYAVGNWDKVPEGEMRYLDALMRHLTQHHKGEKVDPESGELHLAHAAVNIMFLLDKELRK